MRCCLQPSGKLREVLALLLPKCPKPLKTIHRPLRGRLRCRTKRRPALLCRTPQQTVVATCESCRRASWCVSTTCGELRACQQTMDLQKEELVAEAALGCFRRVAEVATGG